MEVDREGSQNLHEGSQNLHEIADEQSKLAPFGRIPLLWTDWWRGPSDQSGEPVPRGRSPRGSSYRGGIAWSRRVANGPASASPIGDEVEAT